MAVLAGLVVAVLGAWAVVGLAGSDDPTGEAVSAGPSAGSTESATSGCPHSKPTLLGPMSTMKASLAAA